MYHPTRGGARGGAAEFSWDKVKESKDREFYLGNSVAAPTGRWQDGRDINWYNKDKSASTSSSNAADERREELRRIKDAELAALYEKLGRPPPSAAGEGEVRVGERLVSGSAGMARREVTGANGAPLDVTKSRWGKKETEEVSEADKKLARKFARDEVRRRRAEAGECDGEEEKKRSRKEDERSRHSSRRRCDEDERDGHRRHRHHRDSKRHHDNDRDDKESRRHRHRSERKSSRSRSRSPESLSRFRHRYRDEGRHRSKGSPSRKEREYRDEAFRNISSSQRDLERERGSPYQQTHGH